MSSNPAGRVSREFCAKNAATSMEACAHWPVAASPKFFLRFFAISFGFFRIFILPSVNLPRVLHSGKKIKKRKRRRPSANDVKSFPSASTALGKAFPECTIFGTRERRLYRMRISRRVFPECCTWGRLPRVQLGLPRVQLALGEATGCCSAYPCLPWY